MMTSMMLMIVGALVALSTMAYAAKCPECDMDTTQLIEHWGYIGQEHTVTTDDGYILTIHQIAGKRDNPPKPGVVRPVIFLQHGLECSSSNWVTNMPWQSAGFIFSDAGFDVYMGNMRGNTYSMRHINLTPKQDEFWAFSYDEMAKYDLPNMIDYVLRLTNQESLYYMGHSQGTMIMFAHQATNPEFAKKIKKFFALAPVANIGHIQGLLSYIAPFTNTIADIIKFLGGSGEFLPSNWLMDAVAKIVCGFWITDPLCDDVLFLIAGADSHQMNKSRTDVYIAHTPAGTSVQNVVHFGQGVNTNKFSMYDYTVFDKNGNMNHYGQKTPPAYDVSKCSIPTYMYSGDMDILADPADVEWLTKNVKHIVKSQELAGFNHLDFIWGLNAAGEIYQPIVGIIKEDQKQEQMREKLRL